MGFCPFCILLEADVLVMRGQCSAYNETGVVAAGASCMGGPCHAQPMPCRAPPPSPSLEDWRAGTAARRFLVQNEFVG